jgi:hypothetical protein
MKHINTPLHKHIKFVNIVGTCCTSLIIQQMPLVRRFTSNTSFYNLLKSSCTLHYMFRPTVVIIWRLKLLVETAMLPLLWFLYFLCSHIYAHVYSMVLGLVQSHLRARVFHGAGYCAVPSTRSCIPWCWVLCSPIYALVYSMVLGLVESHLRARVFHGAGSCAVPSTRSCIP